MRIATAALFIALISALISSTAYAFTLDGVAASIDDSAITISDVKERRAEEIRQGRERSNAEVLDTLINRVLLLREARALRIIGADEDSLIRSYIELRVFAFVSVTETEIKRYRETHAGEFDGVSDAEARERILALLTAGERAERLASHISALRAKTAVRILLRGDEPESR